MDLIIENPENIPDALLMQLIDLISEGAQVDINGLKNRLLKADLIALLTDEGKIATTATLKNPNQGYKETVFKKAGVENISENFTKELGYIVTHPAYEGKGLCQQLLRAFVPRINNNNIYATTRKVSMAHVLNKFDFHKMGDTYDKDLELFVNNSMDIINLIAKSSLHIIVANPGDMEPQSFGSGCIAHYNKRYFLLSVAHVTDIKDAATFIETNLPVKDLQSPLYSVGAMRYFDEYKIPGDDSLKNIGSVEDLSKYYDDTLDITFCEIKEQVELLQPEWDFGTYKISKGNKVCLNLNEAGNPEKGKVYGLCGRVRQELEGVYLKSQPTLKLDLEYQGTVKKGRMHYFKTPELIKDADDYKGCSGAPILDEDGKLVALASSVFTGSQLIFGFSIEECRRLLDLAIATNLV